MTKPLRTIIGVLVVLAASLMVIRTAGRILLTAGETENTRAIVELEHTTWDFGKVALGSASQAQFLIRNSGTRRLVLVEQSRSCGCLSAGKPEIIVPPGGETNLQIRLTTDQLRGRVSKQIEYATNDLDHPVLTFTLVAHIEGEQP